MPSLARFLISDNTKKQPTFRHLIFPLQILDGLEMFNRRRHSGGVKFKRRLRRDSSLI